MGAGTSSGGDGGVLGLKYSDPASARDFVLVDGKVPNDVLGWVGGVVDRLLAAKTPSPPAKAPLQVCSTAPLGG